LEHDELITDLDQLETLAQQHHDDFEVLGYTLELYEDVTDEQVDAWVDSIAQPIVATIDCTECANCCRSLDVYVTEDDANRLSDEFHISLDNIETVIDRDSAHQVKEWGKFRAKPCGFLEGKLCSVYEHRPETCRTYPAFTPDFRWMIDDIIEGTSICPIIYNVLIRLSTDIDNGFLDNR
jgi:uncharacterized protein